MTNIVSRELEFVELEPYEKGFAEYFRTTVRSALLELEANRKKSELVKKSTVRFVATILSVAVVLFWIVIGAVFLSNLGNPESADDFSLWIMSSLPLVLLCILLFAFSGGFNNLGANFRKRMLPLLIGYYGKSFTMREDVEAPLEWMRQAGILEVGDWQSVHYHVSGKYRKVPIDIYRIETHCDKPRSQYHFDGVFIRLPVRRSFKGRTEVWMDVGLKKDYGGDTKYVQLESKEFEDKFDVYSTDPTEARYLLPPDVMAYLIDIHNSYGGNMKVSFVNQSLHVALSEGSGWLLPRDVDHSYLDMEDIHRMLRQMNDIFSLVNLLDEDYMIARDEVLQT